MSPWGLSMLGLAKLSIWVIFLLGSVVVGAAMVVWQLVTDILLHGARKRKLERDVEAAKAEVAARHGGVPPVS